MTESPETEDTEVTSSRIALASYMGDDFDKVKASFHSTAGTYQIGFYRAMFNKMKIGQTLMMSHAKANAFASRVGNMFGRGKLRRRCKGKLTEVRRIA